MQNDFICHEGEYWDRQNKIQKDNEIRWLKNKILSLREKFEKRPKTIREIKDLERQIRERNGEPDVHEWLKIN
jgi:hypothetical protein